MSNAASAGAEHVTSRYACVVGERGRRLLEQLTSRLTPSSSLDPPVPHRANSLLSTTTDIVDDAGGEGDMARLTQPPHGHGRYT